MTQEQKNFIERVGKPAAADMQKSRILASLTIAQAILESGWGKSGLAVKACALFGIKATGAWKGKVFNTQTKECYDGKTYVNIDACFRAYGSWEESIADHSAFLTGAARYAAVIGERDYKTACRAIKAAGYATAPDYAEKLIRVIAQYELTQYDTAKAEGGKTMKIMLDPGHYGKSNQSPANRAYYESEAMWKLCAYLKTALEARKITVGVTRTSAAVDRPVYERGTAAKGYDLFISLHSNAVGSNGADEATDYPVVYVPLNKKGNDLGNKLATVIEKTMKTRQKGRIATRATSSNTDYYGVIRGAVAVGVVGMLIEHSFHTQTAATNWLLSDSNLKRLADAEAAVIAEHYGTSGTSPAPVPTPTPPTSPAKTPYAVRVTTDSLNIRSGAGTNYGVVGTIKDRGVYTIVAEANGSGAKRWGKLKSGAGWIALDYTQKR